MSLGFFFLISNSLYFIFFYCSGHNVTPIQLALNGAMNYPRAAQALAPMLARNALNPADITVLFKLYSSQDPPAVELIRIPQLLGKSHCPVIIFEYLNNFCITGYLFLWNNRKYSGFKCSLRGHQFIVFRATVLKKKKKKLIEEMLFSTSRYIRKHFPL